MADSTRRALRTAYQYLAPGLLLISVLATFIEPVRALWPQGAAILAGLATSAALVSRLLAAFEDQFPGLAIWLKKPDTYKLPDSTRRAIRTAIAGIVGALGFVAGLSLFAPQLVALFPDQAPLIAGIIAAAALLSKIAAALEDAGRRVPLLTIPAKDPAGRHQAGD
ncbi:MAG: hypothetical protein AB7I38_14490 [Dehalococcoidia bacterium]